jgi:hypothetical protein
METKRRIGCKTRDATLMNCLQLLILPKSRTSQKRQSVDTSWITTYPVSDIKKGIEADTVIASGERPGDYICSVPTSIMASEMRESAERNLAVTLSHNSLIDDSLVPRQQKRGAGWGSTGGCHCTQREGGKTQFLIMGGYTPQKEAYIKHYERFTVHFGK